MARKKRRNKGDNDGGSPGWLASYADTMTLLMTFFVLLYSMAEVDSEKLKNLSNAFQQVLQGQKSDSILDFNMDDGQVPVEGEDIIEKNEEDYTYKELKKYIEEKGLEDNVKLNKTEEGVELQLGESLLFDSGKAELIDKSKDVLNKVSEIINNTSGEIRIEGHTDNVPLNKKGKSNWELSVERAVNVVRFFIENKNIKADRLSAVGYGEYKPIADNTTTEGKSANRRVSILFVTEKNEVK